MLRASTSCLFIGFRVDRPHLAFEMRKGSERAINDPLQGKHTISLCRSASGA